MRIGFITGEYPPMQGGIADYTAILAAEMVNTGHDVFVLTSAAATHKTPLHEWRGAGGEVIFPTITNWNRAFFGTLKSWVRQYQLQIVNLQYQTAAFNMAGLLHFYPMLFTSPPNPLSINGEGEQRVGAQYIAPLREVFITTFHDLRFPYLFPKAGFLRPWIVRQLAHHSSGVIVTNRGDETTLRREVNPRSMAQIPLGATVKVSPPTNPGIAREIRAKMGAAEADLVIAHFGFVNTVKGVDTLLMGAKLAQERGVPLHVMMMGERVGASDPTNFAYAQEIDRLAAELGIQPFWTGFLRDEQLGDYFAAADVVALPFKDGASLRRTSLQAALAYGCATITTAPTDDPLPEFVAEEHLLYVPINDPAALGATFERLWGEIALQARLQAGAKLAARRFSWQHIAAQTLTFYEQVLTP